MKLKKKELIIFNILFPLTGILIGATLGLFFGLIFIVLVIGTDLLVGFIIISEEQNKEQSK